MVSILGLRKKYKFRFENNSFDLWRYWAAIGVMLLHYTGYAIPRSETGKNTLWLIRKIVSFFPGVVVLFTISGFLIASSIEHSANSVHYYKKRFSRIYPELWICTIINMFLLLIMAKSKMNYSIILWLATQIIGIAYTPSILKDFASGSVNGALWTIFVEIQLYFVIGLFYKLLVNFKKYQWYILLSVLAFINVGCFYLTDGQEGIVVKLIERCFLSYALWFFIGMFVYIYRETSIIVLRNICIPLLILYYVCYLKRDCIPGYYCDIATGVMCPLIIIGFAYLIPKIRIKTDITYGIFLYHWLVLNIFIYIDVFSRINWLLCLVLYLVITWLLAYGSHWIVGKH